MTPPKAKPTVVLKPDPKPKSQIDELRKRMRLRVIR